MESGIYSKLDQTNSHEQCLWASTTLAMLRAKPMVSVMALHLVLAFHLAMGSPLRIFPPNHLKHFLLLLLHFSTALRSQRSLRKVGKQFPVLLLQFVDNLE